MTPLMALAMAIAVTLAFALSRWRKRTSTFARASSPFASIIMIGVAFAAASVCATLHWHAWQQDIVLLEQLLQAPTGIEADVTGDPVQRDYGMVSTAQTRFGNHDACFRILWPEGSEPATPGHRITLHGSLSSPKQDESGRWNHQNGYIGMVKVASAVEVGCSPMLQGLVCSFRDRSFTLVSQLGGDASGLLAGILLGNRTLFADTELQLAFQTTGLAHLMAVSGTHLAIVMLLLSLALERTPLKRRWRNATLLTALVIYVAITGFAPSAMRACAMCAAALLLGAFKHRAHAFNGLAICVFVFLGLSPSLAFSMGFQLSVLSVLGLVIFSRLAQAWLDHAVPMIPDGISSSIAATLTASFVTLPITVSQFAQLPLISPIANVIVAPIVTVALSIGIIGLVIYAIFEPLGMLILHVAGTIADACARIVHLLADVPGACMPISSSSSLLGLLFLMLVIVLWLRWPLPKGSCETTIERPSKTRLATRAGVLFICTLPIILVTFLGFGQQTAHSPSDSRLVMLDVGQGDSFLVASGGAAVLIDTGEDSDVLIRELAEQGIRRLDGIFISHKDVDHCGALRKLAGIIDIDHVYVHEDLLDESLESSVLEAARWATDGKGAEGVRAGMRFSIGDFTLAIVAPEHGGTSANDDSLIELLEYDADHDGQPEARAIFTGDAESDAMRTVVPTVGDIDILKVAHHGSKGGLTSDQLAALDPELALISVGKENRYGHPTKETLQQLERNGARIYRTDRQGAVTICFEKQGYSVFTEHSP